MKGWKVNSAKNIQIMKFMREACYGGRILRQNKHFKAKGNDKMIALDANSLYPSAMANYSYPTGDITSEPTEKTTTSICRYSFIQAGPSTKIFIAPRRTSEGLIYDDKPIEHQK